ncbi:MAG: hypothetical protein H6733_06180 [Alphaproteobacteria bacterium]|nr:hypothetical protein [Alphaproteobacteria bacterium]
MSTWIVLLTAIAFAEPAPADAGDAVEAPQVVLPTLTVTSTELGVHARGAAPAPVVAVDLPDVHGPDVLAADVALPMPSLRPSITHEVAVAR